MLRLALRSATASKRRLAGTALSVVLGVAFLAGTLVFTDTIERTFDGLFATVYDRTDTYVRSTSAIELDMAGEQRARLPGDLVATVQAVPGVRAAEGFVGGFAQIVGADGEALGRPGQGAPTLGMSDVGTAVSPWSIVDGRPPRNGEVLVDQASFEAGDLEVGGSVRVLTQTGSHLLTLAGTVRFGSVDSPGGASVVVFDLVTAQALLLGGADEIDAVMVAADEGVGEEEVTRRVAAVLPGGTEAITGTQLIEETQDAMREGLGFFSTFLLVFAGIALVVAALTIYNTFQIVVTQRTRELALLRALGATHRQVLGAQLLEAAVVGVVASVVGLAAGVAVAGGLKSMLHGLGIDIPAGGTVFSARTAVLGLAVGALVTLMSAVLPARRAAAVAPMAALRAAADDPVVAHPGRRASIGTGVALAGAGAFALGLGGAGIAVVGVGALLVLGGVFVLGPLVARPAAAWIGTPAAAAGVTGLLARENARRNPTRTARTGGALMIGVSLVAAITIIAATAKDWVRDVVGDQFTGDIVVTTTTFGFGGLSPQVAERLDALPEVRAAAGVRIGAFHEVERDADVVYTAVGPQVALEVFDLHVVDGDVGSLDADGVLLSRGAAEARDLGIGDVLAVRLLDGTTRSLAVQGVYAEDDLAGPFVVSHALHEATGADQFDFAVYLAVADGVPEARARAAIEAAVADQPNATVETRDEYIDAQAAQIDQLVNLMYGLLGLAVVIALFSIANSVSLSVHERTRELGLLRAVGMTRRQTGRAIRAEAGIVALLGTTLGLLVGIGFGWATSVVLRGDGLAAVVVPAAPLVLVGTLAVAGGISAATRPARRATRLDVLRAIATE